MLVGPKHRPLWPEAGNTEAGIVNNALAIPMRSKDKKTNNDEKWTKMILYDIFSD